MKNQFGFFLGIVLLSFTVLGCGDLFYSPREDYVDPKINANKPSNKPPNELPDNSNAANDPGAAAGDSNTPRLPVPKTISGGVLNGKATTLVKPPYPPAARAVRASGAVNVQVTIDEKGDVVSASAVSGHPLLRPAAVEAARASKFSPTVLSGTAVKVTGVIVYNFTPE